jgi:hypothetical protein
MIFFKSIINMRYYFLYVYDWVEQDTHNVKKSVYASDMFDSLEVACCKLRYFDLATTTKRQIVKIRTKRIYQCTGKWFEL